MPQPLAQLDSRQLIPEIARLHKSGVQDLGAHLEAHPDLVPRLLERVVVDEANPPMIALLGGAEAGDLRGPISRFWRHRPDTAARTIGAYARGETSYSEETQITTFDGRAVDVAYSTVFPSSLSHAGISIVSLIDITDRLRATAALAKSEAKFRILFEQMPLPLVQTNAVGLLAKFRDLRVGGVTDLGAYFDDHPGFIDELLEIIMVDETNQPMVEVLGASDKSEINGSIARFWKTHPETVRRSLEARYRGDNSHFEETQVDRLDGRLIDVDYWVAYPPEMNQLGIGLTALIDVTERKQATEEIRRSERKFRDLFNKTPLALWQFNSRAARSLLDQVHMAGVTDHDAWLEANPDWFPAALENIQVTEINDAALEMFGAPDRETLRPKMLSLWLSGRDLLNASAARFRGERSYRVETRIKTMAGEDVDILASVFFGEPDDPNAQNLVGAIDITDRNRAAEEIARSERKFRDLFNETPIALWQLDTREARAELDALRDSGVTDFEAYAAAHPEFLPGVIGKLRILEINEAALRLFGAPDIETLRPNMLALWFDLRDLLGATAARAAGERTYAVETRIRTMDGRIIDIWVNTAFGDSDDPGDPNLVGAIDISERKRADEELARSEAKYRTLFEHMPLPLLYTDSPGLQPLFRTLREQGVEDLGAYLDADPAFLEDLIDTFNISVVNQPMVALLGGAVEADITGSIRPFLKTSPGTIRRSLEARFRGDKGHVEETKIDRLEGGPVDVVYSVAFADPEDPDALSQVSAIDISGRVRAEDMLRKVEAEFAHAARIATLGELTASIAHEVNQPLAAIVTNGEASLRWLARDEPDIEEVRTLAGRMVADARRAADVIARIRTMAAGKAPEHLPMSVNDAAEAAVSFLRHEFEMHCVALSLDLTIDLPAIRADRTQIQQVLVNLAVNAMQAMVQHCTAKPAVTVRTSGTKEGGVLLEVEDNGPGIPDENLAHLFDSFFTTKENGLGIGLSICRSIVEAHGGRISCENLPVGARFSFTLPPA